MLKALIKALGKLIPKKKPPVKPGKAKDKANDAGDANKKRGTPCTDCKKPARRHDPCKTKGNDPTKEKNSMIDPDHADAVNQDIDDIIAGNVPKNGDTWTVNGRTYGKHDGALHPQSGPGIVQMSRMQHQLNKQLNSNSPENATKFAENLKAKGILSQKEIDQVMELRKKCK